MKKLFSGVLIALLLAGSTLVAGCFDGQTTTTIPGNADQTTTVQEETIIEDETTEYEMTEDDTTEE